VSVVLTGSCVLLANDWVNSLLIYGGLLMEYNLGIFIMIIPCYWVGAELAGIVTRYAQQKYTVAPAKPRSRKR
jgi:hypothetical protein